MPLESDININAAKFDPATNSEQSRKLNDALIAKLEKAPNWWEVSCVSTNVDACC